jgi:transcriptional regulator of arginine metabolism
LPGRAVTKQERHFSIKEILAARQVGSQDALRRELRKRGCEVTQATLSRDMQELGIVRVPTAKGSMYAVPAAPEMQSLRPLVGAEVLGIGANESVIVVRTLPGCANTVGEFIDVQKNPDVLGTVAGDNTVLVIPQSSRKTVSVINFLKRKLIEAE